MYSFWIWGGLNCVNGGVPVHPLNIRWRDAYEIGGGMPFSTKLMEGFHFIVFKIDEGIPVYSLGIRCTGFNYVDKGVPFNLL